MNKPADIHVPPDGVEKINPPVETRHQELPFQELTWENFEKLCFRLAGREFQAEDWVRYGRQGQAQGGIDIFVRRADSHYDTWQCKRYKSFSAVNVKSVVDVFLDGEWVDRTKRLLLCVTANLDDTKIQDAIEVQAQRLKKESIVFHVYGADKLSEKLKPVPDLVDDFFGRTWVKSFCGQDAVVTLEKIRHRLDGAAVSRFRRELFIFYSAYFQTLDRGLIGSATSALDASEPPSLLNRFVHPDVLIRETIVGFNDTGTRAGKHRDPERTQESRQRDTGGQDETNRIGGMNPPEQTLHRNLEEWLAEGPHAVVLGNAGSGKSTLLRCLALDLLSEQSSFPALAIAWGQHLPILIPFARWTQMVADNPSGVSLEKMVCTWLQRFSVSPELLDLVREALQDKRLLLLVDGLDEWANETAAHTVLAQLETVVNTHNIAAILSGRPLGVAKLGNLGRFWRTATLAPLTELQQRKLAHIWFTAPNISLSDAPNHGDSEARKSFIDWQIENFFKDLRDGGRLHELAGTPLLLTGLISLRVRHVSLPRNRFQAYEDLTKLLLDIHPQGRSRAAADSAPRFQVLSDLDLRQRALGRLAYEIRCLGADSGFPSQDAKRIIVNFLRDEDEVGLSAEQAQAGAKELLAVNAETSGILIEKAPGEVGFIHAVLEEHLAAIHLAGRPLKDQEAFVAEQCSDSRWSNIILGLFMQLPRPSDIDSLISRIEATPVGASGEFVKSLLLAEAAFGASKRSAKTATRIAANVFNKIETGFWMPEREALLRISLEGLSGGSLHEQLQKLLCRWYPETQWSRKYLFDSMATWSKEPALLESLWRGLYDGDIETRSSAAHAIAMAYSEDPDIKKKLLTSVYKPIDPEIASALLEALTLGWPTAVELDSIIDTARQASNPELKLAGICAAIERGEQTEVDRDSLLLLSHRSNHFFQLKDSLTDALVRGWPKDSVVFDTCCSAWSHANLSQDMIDQEIAIEVLIIGYADNDRIIEKVCKLFSSNETYLSRGRKLWQILRKSFFRHPAISIEIDNWIGGLSEQKYRNHEVAQAATVSGSEVAKQHLLALLNNTGNFVFWQVWALLDVWGMQDIDVSRALTALANAPPEHTQYIAHHLPDILNNTNECRNKLIEIAQLSEVMRPDFLIRGFSSLGIDYTDLEVVDLLLPLVNSRRSQFDTAGLIISQFAADPRVRSLALTLAPCRNAPLSTIASAYHDDQEIRNIIINHATPLPPNMRQQIITHAERRCDEVLVLKQVLANYDNEYEAAVRTAAEAAHCAAIGRRGDDIKLLENKLIDELRSGGPEHDKVNQAALSGLLSLDKFCLFQNLLSWTGKDLLSVSALGYSMDRNSVLLKQMATQWMEISDVLGDTVFDRLSGLGSGNVGHGWNELAPYISLSTAIQTDFISYCRETDKPLEVESLRALARLQRGSQLLREHCVRMFEKKPKDVNISPYDEVARELTAGIILGSMYGSDSVTREILAAKVRMSSGAAVGLCLGWPESPELIEVYKELIARKNTRLRWPAVLHVLALHGDMATFDGYLVSLVHRSSGNIWDFLSVCIDPIVSRISRDTHLYEKLFQRLINEPTADEKASLPRLLLLAKSGDQNLLRWCEDEIAIQMEEAGLSDSGFDIINGRIRPVAQSLLDALMPYGPNSVA